MNALFLGMWFTGEVLMIVYIWPSRDLPLITNYTFNICLVGIISYYKIFPRRAR